MVEQKKQFNESLGKKVDFNIGEIVLVLKRHVKKGQVKKLTHMWRGPYVVIKRFSNQINYQVQLLKNGKDKQIVHALNIKRYTEPHNTRLSKQLESMLGLGQEEHYNDNDNNEAEAEAEAEEEEEFEVEKILDRKYEDGQLNYLVQWKDYDSSFNTWEPITNLLHCQDKIKEYEDKKREEEDVDVDA